MSKIKVYIQTLNSIRYIIKILFTHYSEEYDVQIECEFGKNLGNCWRLEEFNDIADTFLLTVEDLWILWQIAH